MTISQDSPEIERGFRDTDYALPSAWDCESKDRPTHLHFDSVSELEIKLLVTNIRIILIKLVEFPLLKEQNGIVVILLDVPELLFKGCLPKQIRSSQSKLKHGKFLPSFQSISLGS